MKRGMSTGDLSASTLIDADSDSQCLTQVSTRSKKARKNTRAQVKLSKPTDHLLSSTVGAAVCSATDSQPKIEMLENEVKLLKAIL